MYSFCDQYTNIINVSTQFIDKNKIDTIILSQAGKELSISINHEIFFDEEHFDIIYPPTNNLNSNTIKITYITNDKKIICIDEILYKPWSLHIESCNCRTIRGTVIKYHDFIIQPVKLMLSYSVMPYKTELAHREIRADSFELNYFRWHLQKDHDSTDIVEAYIENHGQRNRLKYLARPNDFTFQAELIANKQIQTVDNEITHHKVAIVMPIYNGVDETIAAIESILKFYRDDNMHPYLSIRLVLGLDNPNNMKMKNEINAKYLGNSMISIIINENNLGFIQNCNKLFATVVEDEEVLLINSDVICPQKNWIQELIDTSNMSNDIGTVTPMSNCASIFSFPCPNAENSCIHPEHLEIVNNALSERTSRMLVVPSCHGFCVLIRNTRLPFELKLDPTFGKGYGEENDLSLKIYKCGLKNVACPSVFIYHHESISFSGDKTQLLKRNLQILGERYPNYHADVQNWIAKDFLKPYRNKAIKQLMTPQIENESVTVHISHSRGGGTQEYINNVINENKKNVHVLISSSIKMANCCKLKIFNNNAEELHSKIWLDFNEVDIINEFQWLEKICKIEKIIIHSLIDYADPHKTLGFILDLNYEKEIMIHDYEWISPNQNLIDKNMQILPVKQSEPLFNLDRIDNKYLFSESLTQHQNTRNRFLSNSNTVICPSNATRDLIAKCYPNVNIMKTKYHDFSGDIQKTRIEESINKLQSETIKLAVIGAIGPNKGYKLLCEIARNIFIYKRSIKIIVFGYTLNNDKLLTINPNITITGKYNGIEEFDKLIKLHDPNSSLFLSPWPETYSYTLSLAFKYNLWPFVLNYGAMPERVLQSKFGQVLTSEDANQIVDQIENSKNLTKET